MWKVVSLGRFEDIYLNPKKKKQKTVEKLKEKSFLPDFNQFHTPLTQSKTDLKIDLTQKDDDDETEMSFEKDPKENSLKIKKKIDSENNEDLVKQIEEPPKEDFPIKIFFKNKQDYFIGSYKMKKNTNVKEFCQTRTALENQKIRVDILFVEKEMILNIYAPGELAFEQLQKILFEATS